MGEPVPLSVERAARQLAPSPVRTITRAGSGANSLVFRVDCDEARYALKLYPTWQGDTRRRLDTEWRCLQLMAERGLPQPPRPVARDEAEQCLLMEWIEGATLDVHSEADLDEALGFVEAVMALSNLPECAAFPDASEACQTVDAIVDQIERRLSALAFHEPLRAFLADEVGSACRDACHRGRDGADGSPPLARLIPADFGFHNALREEAGGLRFIDFDYFGWDDPVKLVTDLLLHPAMSLSAGDRLLIVGRLAKCLADDTGFRARLRARFPLFCIRWALILLNPFRADRRAHLPDDVNACERLAADRIAKARQMLSRLALIDDEGLA